MAEDIDNRNYELAYHLNPDIEETGLAGHVQEMEKIMAESGGSVLISREPKKKHLSYPIKKKNYAYFGVVDFSAGPEAIEKINARLKLQNDILRYLIVQKPATGKEIRILGTERPRARMRTHEPSAVGVGREGAEKEKAAIVGEEGKPEQIEKEIEDVLEKI